MEAVPRLTVSLTPGAVVFNYDEYGTPTVHADGPKRFDRRDGAGGNRLLYERINANILRGDDSGRELDELANLVRSMLMPPGLDERIREARDGLRLHLDTEFAGIPWEPAFNRLYGTPLPVARMFNLTMDYRRRVRARPPNRDFSLYALRRGAPAFRRNRRAAGRACRAFRP
jgi:hypothetical protein